MATLIDGPCAGMNIEATAEKLIVPDFSDMGVPSMEELDNPENYVWRRVYGDLWIPALKQNMKEHLYQKVSNSYFYVKTREIEDTREPYA